MSKAGIPSKRDEILDVSEALIRRVGFNGFSTRDVAEAVGIKAASVHYHFPMKADIGVAVTERYTRRFLQDLGEPTEFDGDAKKVISRYVTSFRRALIRDEKLCLCAVLGAEIGSLPSEVGSNTRSFFEQNIEWLKSALTACRLSDAKAKAYAVHVLASLEGAMIVSKTMRDESVFESVAKTLSKLADLWGTATTLAATATSPSRGRSNST
ncbi:MAG: TetR/AcrR family transcriptional regulator [Steroidobacteraceae bacterium]